MKGSSQLSTCAFCRTTPCAKIFKLPNNRSDITRALQSRTQKVCYWHESESERGAKPVRLCPCSSDVNLFSYGEGILDLNAEIPNGALDLGMSQQQLNG